MPTCDRTICPASKYGLSCCRFNTSGARQNGLQFADSIFKFIFFYDNCCILIQISLKYVPKDPIDDKTALVQTMACRLFGAKLLSKPMWRHCLLTQRCITLPHIQTGWQLADGSFKCIFFLHGKYEIRLPTGSYSFVEMCAWGREWRQVTLLQAMAWHWTNKPLSASEPMLP